MSKGKRQKGGQHQRGRGRREGQYQRGRGRREGQHQRGGKGSIKGEEAD